MFGYQKVLKKRKKKKNTITNITKKILSISYQNNHISPSSFDTKMIKTNK